MWARSCVSVPIFYASDKLCFPIYEDRTNFAPKTTKIVYETEDSFNRHACHCDGSLWR